MKIHIGIPTKDLKTSAAFYEQLGFVVVQRYEKPDGLQIVRMSHAGEYVLELLSDPKAGLHVSSDVFAVPHLGVIVDDLDTAFGKLVEQGVKVLKPITDGTMVKRFAFVADPSGNPVELVEA